MSLRARPAHCCAHKNASLQNHSVLSHAYMHLESFDFQSTTDAVVTKTTLPNGNDSKYSSIPSVLRPRDGVQGDHLSRMHALRTRCCFQIQPLRADTAASEFDDVGTPMYGVVVESFIASLYRRPSEISGRSAGLHPTKVSSAHDDLHCRAGDRH